MMFAAEYLDNLLTDDSTFRIEFNSNVLLSKDLRTNAKHISAGIRSLGFVEGDTIVIGLPSGLDFLQQFIGCIYAGVIPILASPDLPSSKLQEIGRRFNSKSVMSSSAQCFQPMITEDYQQTGLRHIDAPGIYLMSSGTTGNSKVIVHTVRSFFQSASSFARLIGYDETSRILHNWPMTYMAGVFNLFAVPLVAGSTVCVQAQFGTETMTQYWDQIEMLEITDVLLTPTMVISLNRLQGLKKRNEYGTTLRTVVCTSAPLHPSTARAFHQNFSLVLRTCYGLTELGGSFTLANLPVDYENYSLGSATNDVEIRTSQQGELEVRTPFIAMGYYDKYDEFHEWSNKDFYKTGDLGTIRNGVVFLIGRNKDVIKRGGVAISLLEVEGIALECKFVLEAIAVPELHAFWGETYVLKVVLENTTSREIARSLLEDTLRSQVLKSGMPKSVDIVDHLPKTPSGKFIRFTEELQSSDPQ